MNGRSSNNTHNNYYTVTRALLNIKAVQNESTAGADASVEASYNVASKKKPGDRSSHSCSYKVAS